MEARAPPSKVLFIRDIPPTLSNEQFENLFQILPGFVSIRRKPFFAFVEFKDSGYATSAMRRHNGYRHHPLDKPLVIDFDKDPRSRDDYISSTSSSSSSSVSHSSSSLYRDSDSSRNSDIRDRDLDRRDHIRSEYKDSRDPYMDRDEKEPSYPKDRDDRDDSRYHDREEDEDTDRSDKHRSKRDNDSDSHSLHDTDKKRTREFDRFEKDRARYRDSYFERDDYPPKRDFHSLPSHHPYGDPNMPYFLPSRPMDHKDACSTLFVSNLPKDVTERELSILFRFTRGFINVRLVHREGKYPICFCDYRDITSAAIAMEMLNGFKMDPKDISSSISIEFDKSRTRG